MPQITISGETVAEVVALALSLQGSDPAQPAVAAAAATPASGKGSRRRAEAPPPLQPGDQTQQPPPPAMMQQPPQQTVAPFAPMTAQQPMAPFATNGAGQTPPAPQERIAVTKLRSQIQQMVGTHGEAQIQNWLASAFALAPNITPAEFCGSIIQHHPDEVLMQAYQKLGGQ